jgi:hypothetical protein
MSKNDILRAMDYLATSWRRLTASTAMWMT